MSCWRPRSKCNWRTPEPGQRGVDGNNKPSAGYSFTFERSAQTTLVRSHQLPFLLCQHYQLPWVLERSFKLEVGRGLLSDRYVLGVPAEAIIADCLVAIIRDLGMPADKPGLTERLKSELSRATTVYFGYEGVAKGSGSLRLYFEYWDEVVTRLKATPASVIRGWATADRPLWEMGVGYKWHVDETRPKTINSLYRSDYWVQPMLPQAEILKQTNITVLRSGMDPEIQIMVKDIIAIILSSSPEIDPVLLQASEIDSPRDSIDLCVHRYNLRLSQLEHRFLPILQSFLGMRWSLSDCLKGRSSDAWITHLSTGISRNGAPYIGLYYESLDSSEPLI